MSYSVGHKWSPMFSLYLFTCWKINGAEFTTRSYCLLFTINVLTNIILKKTLKSDDSKASSAVTSFLGFLIVWNLWYFNPLTLFSSVKQLSLVQFRLSCCCWSVSNRCASLAPLSSSLWVNWALSSCRRKGYDCSARTDMLKFMHSQVRHCTYTVTLAVTYTS